MDNESKLIEKTLFLRSITEDISQEKRPVSVWVSHGQVWNEESYAPRYTINDISELVKL